MVVAFIGPNKGDSMQTPNDFLENTGSLIWISTAVASETKKIELT